MQNLKKVESAEGWVLDLGYQVPGQSTKHAVAGPITGNLNLYHIKSELKLTRL